MAYFASSENKKSPKKLRKYAETAYCRHHVNSKIVHCFSIVDGYNGPEAAQYCNSNLLGNLFDTKPNPKHKQPVIDLGQTISTCFKSTQARMKLDCFARWPRVENHKSLSGTSATVAVFDADQVVIGHVGDTRMYKLKPILLTSEDGDEDNDENFQCKYEVELLTRMHTLAEDQIDRQRIISHCPEALDSNKMQLLWDPKRCICQPAVEKGTISKVRPVTNLTRGLGNFWSIQNETKYQVVSSIPEITEVSLKGEGGDENKNVYFLLATKNVLDHVAPKVVCGVFEKWRKWKLMGKDSDSFVGNPADEILHEAMAVKSKGGGDGIDDKENNDPMTVLVISYEELFFHNDCQSVVPMEVNGLKDKVNFLNSDLNSFIESCD